MVKIVTGYSGIGGSTICFVNLTNRLNEAGFECKLFGRESWHLGKCNAGHTNDIALMPDDILIAHFVRLKSRPPVRTVLLRVHENKPAYDVANIEPFWDVAVFVNEQHRQMHKDYRGRFAIIPNLVEELRPIPKEGLEMVAGVIGSIEVRKQTHVSIERALRDGCERVILFGPVGEQDYYEEFVAPLLTDKVIYAGIESDRKKIYDSVGRVYLSSISEVPPTLVETECEQTNTLFFGNEASVALVQKISNEEILNLWKKLLATKNNGATNGF